MPAPEQNVACGTCNRRTLGKWIDCDTCSLWFHQKCQNVDFPVNTQVKFSCRTCVEKLKDQMNLSLDNQSENNQKTPNASAPGPNYAEICNLRIERSLIEKRLILHREYLRSFNPNETTVENLQCRLELMNEIYSEYGRIHTAIQKLTTLTNEGEVLELATDYERFCNDFCLVRGVILRKIAQFKTSNTETSSAEIMKLPPIPIPRFKGELKEWISFRDAFEALVVNKKMSEMSKLHYLRESVKDGDAWRLISEIKPTEDAFAIAWDTLKKRYDNKKVIIESHLNELFKLKSVSNGTSSELRVLTENCDKQLKQLKALGEPVDEWSSLIIHMVKFRLDDETKKAWENEAQDYEDMPTWYDMEEFLSKRCRVLEAFESGKRKATVYKPKFKNDKPVNSFFGSSNETKKCEYCSNSHLIQECRKFVALKFTERQEFVKKKGLCFKCLVKGHLASGCDRYCEVCKGNHHKALHIDKTKKNDQDKEPKTTGNETTLSNFGSSTAPGEILLMTAKIKIRNHEGDLIEVRALLDGGSQSNFMTEGLRKKLKLDAKDTNITVKGITGQVGNVCRKLSTEIYSKHTDYKKTVEFLVIPKIIDRSPFARVDKSRWKIPNNIMDKLADIQFTEPCEIDVLLGIEVFLDTLLMEQVEINGRFPIFQNTKFGWVAGGRCQNVVKENKNVQALTCVFDLQEELKKFWEIKDDKPTNLLTDEQRYCETHFQKNCTRDESGRYTVRIPFNSKIKELGDSKSMAVKQFHCLERRLTKNPELKQEYVKFMREYVDLGHMVAVKEPTTSECYVLPHHAVFKPDSTTTKLRVVFNASMETSSGVSLNDCQYVGPVVQDDLFSIMIRFRTHPIVMSADVEKMFRMMKVHQEDRKYQIIAWRENPEDELKFYELATITYGYASAAHLATGTLKKLSEDEAERFPLASAAIGDFYMDDFMGGCRTVEEAKKLVKELIAMFRSAGMNLRKWASNCKEVLQQLSPNEIENPKCLEESSINESIKVLGLIWYPVKDEYSFKLQRIGQSKPKTKRELLSEILKLFDPVGYLSPIIVTARLMMQDLWLLKITWDEELPEEISARWQEYSEQLHHVNDIRINRCVVEPAAPQTIELHGFCDASEKAYGASCYLRVIDEFDNVKVNLLCSRFRVAPLKKRTLPQLELCGAQLLAELVVKLIEVLKYNIDEVVLWTDSLIVLCWLRIPCYRLKTFVANRVSEIRELTSKYAWNHVPSKQNPADLLTRGVTSSDLISLELWWHGPKFMLKSYEEWPLQPQNLDSKSLPETKGCDVTVLLAFEVNEIVNAYSDLRVLQRYIAYWQRFIYNKSKKNDKKLSGFLLQVELRRALDALIRLDQQRCFPKEYERLKNQQPIDSKSSIKSLNPFMDSSGMIRVGGRLKASKLNYDSRHQILLSKDSDLTCKLIVQLHEVHGHVGPQGLLSIIRQRYWPVHGKQLIRVLFHNCVTCAIAEVDWSDVNINRLARYERVQQATQHFYKRFHDDYLNSLQNRTKAFRNELNIEVGQMVVLRDENLKPLNWNMGRIVEVHPGKDGIVRVVTVRTKTGNFKRAVNKIVLLPVET